MQTRRNISRTKTTTFYAVGFALLVQSLFPSGYMPSSMASGWIAMLCPDGLPAAFVQQLGGQGGQSHHGSHHLDAGHAGSSDQDHGSAGYCQLGSGVDQPIDVSNQLSFDAVVLETPQPITPPEVLLTADRFRIARSRAPPVS